MIDTHTHLYIADSFPDGGETAVKRAIDGGIDRMVLPAIDIESVAPLLSLHEKFPGHTAVAMGLHPTEVEADWRDELREILDRSSDEEIVAIGETGLDLYWEQRYLSRQMDAFGEQLQIAAERDLPVIVHNRDAFKETIELLNSFGSGLPQLVFHSFTAGKEEMESLLEAAPGCYFGINGVVTFKNAAPLREAIESMPAERIVTETDSPFLAPVPFRGKTNESAYIPYIVQTIAKVKNVDEETVRHITVENACRLFPRMAPPPQE